MYLHVYYSALTRFDKANSNTPFSGSPGALITHRTFNNHPEISYDIRVIGSAESRRPHKPGAKILAFGTAALHHLINDNSIHKHRGYCLNVGMNELIATYEPIDAWEFRESDDDDADDDDAVGGKDVAKTKKSNYLFWILADFEKLLRVRESLPALKRVIQPNSTAFIKWLNTRPANARLVIDIETRIQDHNLDCIGVMDVQTSEAFVVPFYTPDNRLAYDPAQVAGIWRAFYNIFLRKDITIIGHNLAFDLSILSAYYKLPIPTRVYDTMLAMHRQNPLVEKSLSHAISYYTSAPRNHKGDAAPNTNPANFQKLLSYNADDIRLTTAVYLAQRKLHETNPGLASAVDSANSILPVTLLMSITGIVIDTQAREIAQDEHNLALTQLLRIAKILSGLDDFNPNSSKQVASYLYGTLKYEPLEYTETGAPSTAEKTLYKLQLKQANPLIAVIITYKHMKKSASMLEAKLYEPTTL